jgi:hypothetical protein
MLAILLLMAALCFCDKNELISPDPSISVYDFPADSLLLQIKYGNKAIVDNKLEITFNGEIVDSRCPMDVVCVWAGDGGIVLHLKKASEQTTTSLHTNLTPKETVFGGYIIKLKELNPYPKSNVKLKKEDYSVLLTLKRL